MLTDDFIRIKFDVINFFKNYNNPSKVEFIFLEKRYFSEIYEIHCFYENNISRYILKISTTTRSCENEFKLYSYLDNKNIRSLKPVYYSDKFNYLITKKEQLDTLTNLLIKCRNNSERQQNFIKLGRMIRELELKTGNSKRFNEKEYLDYVLPRIESLDKLKERERIEIFNKIMSLTEKVKNRAIIECLVSDFTLGNIHVNSEGDIVLVDMGDATIGNHYDNISYIYLSIKFGALAQYVDIKGNSKNYFTSFLQGYEIDKIDDDLMALFHIKHLINMISFIDEQKIKANRLFRLLSNISDAYLIFRYKNFLRKIIATRLIDPSQLD